MHVAKAALPWKGLLWGTAAFVAGRVPGGAVQPPQNSLEQGKEPAPPRAISGAV